MSWVIRDDFPRSRRGWEPDAVLEHLREVEAEMEELAGSTRMSGRAAEGVRRVVQAAEETLAELVNEAQRELERASVEAEDIRAAAREDAAARLREAGADDSAAALEAENARHRAEELIADAQRRADAIAAAAEEQLAERTESVLAAADAEAAARIAAAERAVAGLIAEARVMGERVEEFGAELTRGLGTANGDAPEGPRAAAQPSANGGNGTAVRNGAVPAGAVDDLAAVAAPARGRRFRPGGGGGSIPPRPITADGAPAGPPAAP